MKKINIFLLILSTLCISNTFSYEARISEGNESLRKFEIPLSIYKSISLSDNKNLYIYDSKNILMPSIKIKKENKYKENSKIKEIKFFIKEEFIQKKNKSIKDNESKVFIKVKKQIIFIENKDKQNIKELELFWNNEKSISLNFEIKESNDLSSWRSISSNNYLYELNHLNNKLVNKKIILKHSTNSKYLSITFIENENNIDKLIYKINAKFITTERVKIKTYTQRIDKKDLLLKDNNIYFNLPTGINIKSIKLISDNETFLFKGEMYSKRNKLSRKERIKEKLKYKKGKKDLWRYENSFLQYQLLLNKKVLKSEDIKIYNINRVNKWKISLLDHEILKNDNLFSIEYRYISDDIVFLAKGVKPYFLRLYTNTKYKENNLDLYSSLNNEVIQRVELLDFTKLKKTNKIKKVKPGLFSYVLTFIFLFSIILMFYISIKIFIDIKRKKKE